MFAEDKDFSKVKNWHFIYRNIPAYQKEHFAIDLLGQDKSINAAFMRQHNIKQAIDFLEQDRVKLSYLTPAERCSANMLFYKAPDSHTGSFIFRSDLSFNDDNMISAAGDDDFEIPVLITDNENTQKYGSSVSRYEAAFEKLKDKADSYINVKGNRLPLKEYAVSTLKNMLMTYSPADIYNHILLTRLP